ncbi:hypothetical protein BCR44DRAFT_37368 [Catenaria anguillulae PL171]|uniref:Uncharacterized protein n=1 Tax=Catenaria anguillulae PL171 TaxID=765915 RepID=A0A1Y2HRQ8_9FUNG|nr:hypothetical protein BCR44DRAFT_37368 [Catenaria anguillulae PL171]
MPRKRLLPRTVRPRSPPLAHRHHPLTHDHSFLARFRYFALHEAYSLAALDALHAHILAHDFHSALHLLSLLLRAHSPPPFLTVWHAGMAILRGLLVLDPAPGASATATATAAAGVTPMSVVRLLMALLAMDDDATAVYRPQLAVELALTLVCAGQEAQAYTHLDPLASQFPYADDLHVVGVLGMVCVALIEKHMPTHASPKDDEEDDEEEDEGDDDTERSRTSSRSRAKPPVLSAAAGPYLTSARSAFDRLLAVHPSTPTYLEYHLRYLTLSGMQRQIPIVIHRVLDALAHVVADPGSLDAAELNRRRDHVWALAGVYGVTRRVQVRNGKRKSSMSSTLQKQTEQEQSVAVLAIDDPTLASTWLSSSVPTSSSTSPSASASLPSLLDQFDYPVHSPTLWRQLVHLLSTANAKSRIATLFQARKEWWFALHLASHARDPLDVLVYKLAVMHLVAPAMADASKHAVWMARRRGIARGSSVDKRQERRAVLEALSGLKVKVEHVYVDAESEVGESYEDHVSPEGSGEDDEKEESNSDGDDDDSDDSDQAMMSEEDES